MVQTLGRFDGLVVENRRGWPRIEDQMEKDRTAHRAALADHRTEFQAALAQDRAANRAALAEHRREFRADLAAQGKAFETLLNRDRVAFAERFESLEARLDRDHLENGAALSANVADTAGVPLNSGGGR